MAGRLIDTHCHLDSEGFHQDIDQVIQRAVDSGIVKLLSIGTTLETSQAAVLLSNRYPCISAVVGIHPNYTHEAKPGDWDIIEELATHPHVVGIGETGLDRYWDYAPIDTQREYFVRHIELSRRLKKPFVVHCREAESEVIETLTAEIKKGPLIGLMHSFCGTAETLRVCLEAGLYISFAGMLTFRKNDDLRAVAKMVPHDRLLVETDAPYLAPLPYRGKRNEPSYVRYTNDCLAEVHGLTPEEMAELTTANAMRLFNLPSAEV